MTHFPFIPVPRCDEDTFMDWESEADSAVNHLPSTPQQPTAGLGQPQLIIIMQLIGMGNGSTKNHVIWMWSSQVMQDEDYVVQSASQTQEHSQECIRPI